MITIFIRSVIIYVLVVVMMRLIGKRQMGELQPYEFVLTLIMAELAASPISSTNVPLFYGVIPLFTLFLLSSLFSAITLKVPSLRGFLNGRPNIIIEKGKISIKELNKTQYSLNDLMEQLRSQNQLDINEIEYAILETNGNLSIIPKKSALPPTAKDLSLTCSEPGLTRAIILDGKIDKKNLQILCRDESWLRKRAKSLGYLSIEEILIFTVDEQGKIFIQGKN